VNKTAVSASQLANCILLYAYSSTNASSQMCDNKQKDNNLFNKLA